jgi:hypothetical protein
MHGELRLVDLGSIRLAQKKPLAETCIRTSVKEFSFLRTFRPASTKSGWVTPLSNRSCTVF